MNKWLEKAERSLSEVIEISSGGSIPLQHLYMLAPVLYAKENSMDDDSLLQEMIEVTENQVAEDCSLDEKSIEQYKFHYVSSYLFCYVVAGKVEEMKYDRIMEYVCSKMDLFTDDYGYG
jgi:hypothetical protein